MAMEDFFSKLFSIIFLDNIEDVKAHQFQFIFLEGLEVLYSYRWVLAPDI